MAFTIFAFLVIFLLIASAGLILFSREAMFQRIAAVTSERNKPRGIVSTIQQTGVSITSMIEQFEKVMPKSQADVSIVRQRLIRAGLRQESAVKTFYGAKILVPLTLATLLLVTGLGRWNPF